MQDHHSLHLTIKHPPNPDPIRTLGIFDDPDNPDLKKVISHFLDTMAFEPKSTEFLENVKDEVLKLLSSTKPIAVARKDNITIVYFQNTK